MKNKNQMNQLKLKTYVLMVSEYFPKTHKKSGQQTAFPFLIKKNVKIHTLRSNYDLWAKRFEQIYQGKACLSVRVWSDQPYRSQQIELFNFTNTNKIGLQKLENPENFVFAPIDGKMVNWEDVAKNDGLSFEDFREWFNVRNDKPMAVIHFTEFRY